MDDMKELVDRLSTLAGMILEDASADALSIEEVAGRLREKLQRIRKAGADATILADAATVALEFSHSTRRSNV